MHRSLSIRKSLLRKGVKRWRERIDSKDKKKVPTLQNTSLAMPVSVDIVRSEVQVSLDFGQAGRLSSFKWVETEALVTGGGLWTRILGYCPDRILPSGGWTILTYRDETAGVEELYSLGKQWACLVD
ncbi:hypothetical protein Tco_0093806 [Tanacetum coccineum]